MRLRLACRDMVSGPPSSNTNTVESLPERKGKRVPRFKNHPSVISKKDKPSDATMMRVLVRVLRRRGHTYELQTKHGILQKYGPQNLKRIDQCTAKEDGKELGDNRRKITLRYTAKASYRMSMLKVDTMAMNS